VRATALAAALALAAPTARADDYLAPHPGAAWWASGELDALGVAAHAPRGGGADGLVLATAWAGYAPSSLTAIVVSGQLVQGDAPGGLAEPADDAIVRDPGGSALPFLGTAFVDQVIPLSRDRVLADRAPRQLLAALPGRRLELRIGQLWAPDWFGGEPHGFRDAAIAHDGAWDYPADRRGYALGALVEYASALWRVRIAELAMPTRPRGDPYTLDAAAHGEVGELRAHVCVLGHAGWLRLGGFLDHAAMGSYTTAVAVFEAGESDVPDVTQYRVAGAERRGAFAGVEQDVGAGIHAFAGASTSDGGYETFGTSEIDDSVRLGATWRVLGRTADDTGLAFATSGLAQIHETYLALGGTGPVASPIKRYAREDVVEAYYRARVTAGLSASANLELAIHPGYDATRSAAVLGVLGLTASL